MVSKLPEGNEVRTSISAPSQMERLRLGLISGLANKRYGGPSTVLHNHAEALSELHRVTVYCVDAGGEDLPSFERAAVKTYRLASPRRWYRGRGIGPALLADSGKLDVLHAHMLWDYPVLAAACASSAYRKPLVISPHGSLMLERSQGFHKRLYRNLVVGSILKRTAAVHVLNEAEAHACRSLGVKNDLFVIPNGLPTSSFDLDGSATHAQDKWPRLGEYRVALYLGRIHPIKGLDLLLKAFAAGVTEYGRDWLLVIAGPEECGYRQVLNREVDELGIGRNVLFTGPVYGAIKDALLSRSDLCILPSRSEGFSVSLLEAAAKGKPSVYTTACNFPELARSGGGFEVPPDEEGVSGALRSAFGTSPTTLRAMGVSARHLALRSYTLQNVTAQLDAMYRHIVR